jgi:hypothetical protein
MYERFTGQARQAMQLARREAQRFQHDYLGTEHVLLGVLREGSGVAGLLGLFHLDPDKLYRDLATALPSGSDPPDWEQLPLTPRAKRVLEYADEEARGLGHEYVGPEHLLLGLLREEDSEAARFLQDRGLNSRDLARELAKLPAPENRDLMLQAQPRSGPPVPPDPSVRDLEAIVSEAVLPAEACLTDAEGAAPGPTHTSLPVPSVRWDAGDPVFARLVERQLRVIQFLLGALGGTLAGALSFGYAGAAIGFFVGLATAGMRDSLLGGLVGLLLGMIAGLVWTHPRSIGGFLGSLVGVLVGACLGDWRRFSAAWVNAERKPPGQKEQGSEGKD